MQKFFKLLSIILVLQSTVGQAQEVPDSGDRLEISGEWRIAFDWTKDRCNDNNIPDLPARAFRTADSTINMIIAHMDGYMMRGEDFRELKIDCDPIYHSTENADPSYMADREWIASVYTPDGLSVYALIHNEYQGNAHSRARCPSGEYFSCWNNTVTSMLSKDGGRSFTYGTTPPNHMVANYPQPYVPDGGIYGAFSPSNIVRRGKYYYAFIKIQTYPEETQHVCVMRTAYLDRPDSWRFWDGSAYEGVFVDPYTTILPNFDDHICPPIAYEEIAQIYEGLTYNVYLRKFVLVGTSNDPREDPARFGFYYAVSDDLIHWERRKLLLEVPLPWTVADPGDVNYLYPSLIDPNSRSMSFETTGRTAYLYFTRLNFGHPSLDRDLIRVPVRFTRGGD